MFSARLIIMAIIPFAVLNAFAQENIIVQKAPTVLLENSSEHNRMGKTIDIAAMLVNFKAISGAGAGATVGYHLDRNTIIQVEMSKNDDEFLWDRAGEVTTGLHLKKFFANSFYVNVGIDYSTINFRSEYLFTSSENKDEFRFRGNVTSAVLLIGNQWTWDNFNLGCDWAGFAQPIMHTLESEFTDNTFDSSKSMSEKRQRELFKDGRGHLLRFYVGASF